MTKRALVIGSELAPLKGPINDVRAMAAMLRSRGFIVDARPQATRADILDGYDALIGASRRGEAALVYYSGHGYYSQLPGDARRVQCIAPVDIKSGTEWRGITSWELSIKLKQLTSRTHNVTVILDCCHASHMSRDAAVTGAVARALPHPVTAGLDAYLAAMREQYGPAFDDVDRDGNPHAVRFVATGKTEPAWEAIGSDGLHHGYFTSTLLDVLRELGTARVSWAAVARIVRARVLGRYGNQRPEVEGPAHRGLFELDPVPDVAAASVAVRGGAYEIQSGLLAGDAVGDIYAVLAENAAAYEAGKEVAQLEIVAVNPVVSTARCVSGPGSLHTGAVAMPIIRTAPKHPVRVEVRDDAREAVAVAITAARTLVVADANESAPIATLKLAGDDLSIEDARGPLFRPTRFPDDLTTTVTRIAGLGIARSIHQLLGEHGVRADEVEVELGLVDGDVRCKLPATGASLALRDRVYISVRNRADRPLWFHIFNIGIRGTITSLASNLYPSGVPLAAGSEPFVLGGDAGLEIAWPDDVPRDTLPRTDEVVVFATTTEVDLQGLETRAFGAAARSPGTPLQALVSQLQDGLARSADTCEGFYATRLSYELHPREAAIGRLSFEIDDAPGGLAAARAPDAWRTGADTPISPGAGGPDDLAIHIGELVVDRNPAWGTAEVRVDALVCTRSADGRIATWTHHFDNGDGQRLSRAHSLLFRGAVRDFVDIVLFVSRDDGGRRPLADLLAERADRAELDDARGALAIADDGRPWIAAVGASAVLARMAYGLLRDIAGRSTGLYRSSFLADERFGVGRHPPEALYRAQNVSFSLLVESAELEA